MKGTKNKYYHSLVPSIVSSTATHSWKIQWIIFNIVQVVSKSLSRSLICQVSLYQPIVLELEFYAMLVLEVFLVSIHKLHKVLLEARLEVEILRNFVRNIWQIEKYHNNVWLLTVVIIVVIIISDKFFSFINMGANVAKCLWVVRIAQNTVPRSALNRLFGHSGHIKNTNNSWIFNFNTVVFFKILRFFYNLVSLL
jgi:hypothetical protein